MLPPLDQFPPPVRFAHPSRNELKEGLGLYNRKSFLCVLRAFAVNRFRISKISRHRPFAALTQDAMNAKKSLTLKLKKLPLRP
jgi:hypothetical protein